MRLHAIELIHLTDKRRRSRSIVCDVWSG